MESSVRTRMSAFVGGALLALSQAGNAVTVSQTPLFITTAVTPNVMLVVDNSGSMNSIIWPEAFDSTQTYADWSPLVLVGGTCAGGTVYTEGWTSLTGSITPATLQTSRYRGSCGGITPPPVTCPTSWTRGRSADGLTTKCLRLPDPVGGNATRYSGSYLNFLFTTYAHNTDLRGGVIPDDYRMRVARNVATNVVNANTNLRLGLTTFNTDAGGRVLQKCNTGNTSALNSSISGLTATSWTPLAETLYEVTRYFRGMVPFAPGNGTAAYESPIQYACQKSFVIVITDGYPTQDTNFPTDDADDPNDWLPNWDRIDTVTTVADYPNFKSGSDGFRPVGATTDEGHTLWMDDIAKFAYDTDMRKGSSGGVDFDPATFTKQNLVTYTVGFAASNPMLADAARLGTGIYKTAGNEAELTAALQAALADIDEKTRSAASVATNSTRLATDSFIFQALFSPKDWGGDLLAFPIGRGGAIAEIIGGVPVLNLPGTADDRTGWSAAGNMPAASDRKIYTYDPGTTSGMEFEWGNLTVAQKGFLNKNASGGVDSLGANRVAYLRGDQSNEAPDGNDFRARSKILGDIINSDPAFAGQQNYGFDLLPGAEGGSYKEFLEAAAERTPMVYVAANDGMLHGFNAVSGVESFAFMPNSVYPTLSRVTDAGFNLDHRLINDGAPKTLDAYLGGSWKTVLLGSLGGGGEGVYALDVTDPDYFDGDSVLWEFTSTNDSDMGFAVPQATIARLNGDHWVAIVPNGYNSDGANVGTAVLFILDLETGAKLKEIDTGAGGDNGLSAATPVDVDGDRITDYIYAGDLKGNLWKFDVTSADPDDWKIAFSGAPLYTACSSDPCTAGNRQPITARPEVGISPPEGYFVYFGTGRYFAVGDVGVGTGANTIYAIRDKNEKGSVSQVLPGAGRSTLLEQTIVDEQTYTFGGYTENIRTSTNLPITDTHDGWFMDLPTAGERQVSTPILRGGRLIFTTVIPSGDVCSAGGDSWLMEIDALTGSRLTESPFDLNRDRSFNAEDFAFLDSDDPDSKKVPVSGRQSKQGIIKTPGIVTDDRIEYKYASGSAGGIDTTVENAGKQRGRQSWREIQ